MKGGLVRGLSGRIYYSVLMHFTISMTGALVHGSDEYQS